MSSLTCRAACANIADANARAGAARHNKGFDFFCQSGERKAGAFADQLGFVVIYRTVTGKG